VGMSCIYQIVNLRNGKFYVGRAMNIRRRWHTHLCLLRCGQHHAPHLQRAWNKYGESAFELRIVESCADRSRLRELEQAYLSNVTLRDQLYNLSLDAGNSGAPSVETRRKMSEAAKQRAPISDETRQKRSLALRGMKKPPRTEAARQRYREGTLRAYQNDPMLRVRLSEKSRAQANTAESRERRSAAQLRRFTNPEERHKLSLAHRGLRRVTCHEP